MHRSGSRDTASRRARAVLVAVAVAISLISTACATGSTGSTGSAGSGSAAPGRAVTEDYQPGLAADVYLPTGVTSAAVVVLVPGGAWQSADRTGLGPLAQYLADAGMVAVNTTHRAVADGGRFPGPVQEINCSVAFARQRAREAGLTVTSVVVLGHSSGAHLGALAALGGAHFEGRCSYPRPAIDAFVGLAGAYDVDRLQYLAEPLFGMARADDPERWADGNPLIWARKPAGRHPLRVLLMHGGADVDLPRSFSTSFDTALRAGGHDVTLEIVPGATHQTLYTPQVCGRRLLAWLEST